MKTLLKKSFISFSLILSFFVFVAPVFVFAVENNDIEEASNPNFQLAVKCDGSDTSDKNPNACNFAAFMRQIRKIINFLIYITIPITALGFAFVGFKYMTAQGGDKVSDAKKMAISLAKGFALMLGAWLLVHTAITIFVDQGFIMTFLGDFLN